MQELEVPTRKLVVNLETTLGERIQGNLFAGEPAFSMSDGDLLLCVLNDEREFLPFLAVEPDLGRAVLNKAHIVSVQLEGSDLEDEDAPGLSDETCTLRLAGGASLVGRVRLLTPDNASRLVDKLNQSERFVVFAAEDGTHFVQRGHMVRAQ